MKFHQNIFKGYQVRSGEQAEFCGGQTNGQLDGCVGKTIGLPALKGGDIDIEGGGIIST